MNQCRQYRPQSPCIPVSCNNWTVRCVYLRQRLYIYIQHSLFYICATSRIKWRLKMITDGTQKAVRFADVHASHNPSISCIRTVSVHLCVRGISFGTHVCCHKCCNSYLIPVILTSSLMRLGNPVVRCTFMWESTAIIRE